MASKIEDFYIPFNHPKLSEDLPWKVHLSNNYYCFYGALAVSIFMHITDLKSAQNDSKAQKLVNKLTALIDQATTENIKPHLDYYKQLLSIDVILKNLVKNSELLNLIAFSFWSVCSFISKKSNSGIPLQPYYDIDNDRESLEIVCKTMGFTILVVDEDTNKCELLGCGFNSIVLSVLMSNLNSFSVLKCSDTSINTKSFPFLYRAESYTRPLLFIMKKMTKKALTLDQKQTLIQNLNKLWEFKEIRLFLSDFLYDAHEVYNQCLCPHKNISFFRPKCQKPHCLECLAQIIATQLSSSLYDFNNKKIIYCPCGCQITHKNHKDISEKYNKIREENESKILVLVEENPTNLVIAARNYHENCIEFQEEKKRKIEEEESNRKILEEQERLRIIREEENRRKAEEDERRRVEEEERRRAEEEERRRIEEERRKAEEEERIRIAFEEHKRRTDEEYKIRLQEIKRQYEEENRKREADEYKRKMEEDLRRKTEEEKRRNEQYERQKKYDEDMKKLYEEQQKVLAQTELELKKNQGLIRKNEEAINNLIKPQLLNQKLNTVNINPQAPEESKFIKQDQKLNTVSPISIINPSIQSQQGNLKNQPIKSPPTTFSFGTCDHCKQNKGTDCFSIKCYGHKVCNGCRLLSDKCVICKKQYNNVESNFIKRLKETSAGNRFFKCEICLNDVDYKLKISLIERCIDCNLKMQRCSKCSEALGQEKCFTCNSCRHTVHYACNGNSKNCSLCGSLID